MAKEKLRSVERDINKWFDERITKETKKVRDTKKQIASITEQLKESKSKVIEVDPSLKRERQAIVEKLYRNYGAAGRDKQIYKVRDESFEQRKKIKSMAEELHQKREETKASLNDYLQSDIEEIKTRLDELMSHETHVLKDKVANKLNALVLDFMQTSFLPFSTLSRLIESGSLPGPLISRCERSS